MTFSEEIAKPQSERYTLVKVRLARNITSLVANPSSNIYTYTFTEYVTDILIQGVSGTEVSDTPNAQGEWNYIVSTGVLTVYTTTTPSTTSSAMTMEYALFFTNHASSVESSVGSNNETDLVKFLPRLIGKPEYTQTASNQIYGVVSAESSGLNVADSDGRISNLITSDESAYKRRVDGWLVANGETSQIMEQVIVGLSINNRVVTFRLNDRLALLLEGESHFGDNYDEAYFIDGDEFSSVDARFDGMPVPLLYCTGTPANYDTTSGSDTRDGNGSHFGILSQDTPLQGLRSGSDNSWTLGRIPSGYGSTPLRDDTTLTEPNSMSYVYAPTETGGQHSGCVIKLVYNSTNNTELRIGDALSWTLAGATAANDQNDKLNVGSPYHGVVIGVDYRPTNTEYYVACDFGGMTDISTFTMTALEVTDDPYICFTMDGKRFIAVPNFHFTTTINSTMAASKSIQVDFRTGVNGAIQVLNSDFDLETTVTDFHAFDTSTTLYFTSAITDLQYQFNYNDTAPLKQEQFVENLILGLGLSVNAASFTTAGSDHVANVYTTIPYMDSLEAYASASDYIEDLLGSVGGLVYYDTSTREVHYKILNTLGSPSETISNNEIIAGTFRANIKFRDISNQILSINEGIFDDVTVRTVSGSSIVTGYTTSRNNNLARVLHNSQKSKTINHIMENFTTSSRDVDVSAIRSSPFIEYSFALPAKYLGINVSDLFTLEHDKLFGTATTEDCMVLSYTKSEDGVQVSMTPLRGL